MRKSMLPKNTLRSKEVKIMKNSELGHIVVTRGIDEKTKEDSGFAEFINESVLKYVVCDWGDTCEEDARSNNEAVEKGDARILAVYTYPKTGEKIWIITEWDRSVTTILFPHEY